MRLSQALGWVVLAGILGKYPRYHPPDFTADFLVGRRGPFQGADAWAFFAHRASGPLAILFGLLLVDGSFRRRSVFWHRVLGRVHMAAVLRLLVPSGLWMASYADGGVVVTHAIHWPGSSLGGRPEIRELPVTGGRSTPPRRSHSRGNNVGHNLSGVGCFHGAR